jgi:hypothetical protein
VQSLYPDPGKIQKENSEGKSRRKIQKEDPERRSRRKIQGSRIIEY